MDVAGWSVLVTGATSGFGEAIARRFVLAGAHVVGTGRRSERLEALAAELGPRFSPRCFDVRDDAARQRELAGLVPDLLVLNAGLALGAGPVWKAEVDDVETMIATNVRAVAMLVRELLPDMVARRHGHLVLLGSVAGSAPYPGGNVYGGTKAFVSQYAQNLRADLVGTGIRATVIEPAMCETEFSVVRFHGDAEAARRVYAGMLPLTATDIAETVWWVATCPPHMTVSRVELFPTAQAHGPFQVART